MTRTAIFTLILILLFYSFGFSNNYLTQTQIDQAEEITPFGEIEDENIIIMPGEIPKEILLLQENAFLWGRIGIKLLGESRDNGWHIRILNEQNDRVLDLSPKEIHGEYFTPPIQENKIRISVPPNGEKIQIFAIARGGFDLSVKVTIGTPNIRKFLSNQNDMRLQSISKGIVLFVYQDGKKMKGCNGFLASMRFVVTNFHCGGDKSAFEQSFNPRIYLDFISEKDWGQEVLISDIKTSEDLDLSILRLKTSPPDEYEDNIFKFSKKDPSPNDDLIIVQHYRPQLWGKRISDDNDCEVKNIPVVGRNFVDKVDFEHGCDTEKGTSGAPVLSRETLSVVGLHHWHPVPNLWEYNKAIRIEEIFSFCQKTENQKWCSNWTWID
ncbi:MAG: serine protease [Nitrospirales bacterium]